MRRADGDLQVCMKQRPETRANWECLVSREGARGQDGSEERTVGWGRQEGTACSWGAHVEAERARDARDGEGWTPH